MTEKKETYDLDLYCTNCGNEFTETIPFGCDFTEDGWGAKAHYGRHTKFKFVYCPNCGSDRIIKEKPKEKKP